MSPPMTGPQRCDRACVSLPPEAWESEVPSPDSEASLGPGEGESGANQLDEGAGPHPGRPAGHSVSAKRRLCVLAADRSRPAPPHLARSLAGGDRVFLPLPSCSVSLFLPDLHTADADLDFHLVALRKLQVGLTSQLECFLGRFCHRVYRSKTVSV